MLVLQVLRRGARCERARTGVGCWRSDSEPTGGGMGPTQECANEPGAPRRSHGRATAGPVRSVRTAACAEAWRLSASAGGGGVMRSGVAADVWACRSGGGRRKLCSCGRVRRSPGAARAGAHPSAPGGRCGADYERQSLGESAAMAAVAALPATGVRSADGSTWRGAWRQGGTCGRRRRERMARSLGQQREQGCLGACAERRARAPLRAV